MTTPTPSPAVGDAEPKPGWTQLPGSRRSKLKKKMKGAMDPSKLPGMSRFFQKPTAAGLGELPEEILEPFLEYIPTGRLAKLITVNHKLYRIGLPILYRYVYIHHPHREILFYKALIDDNRRWELHDKKQKAIKEKQQTLAQAAQQTDNSNPEDDIPALQDRRGSLASFVKELRRSPVNKCLCNKRGGVCRAIEPYTKKKFNTTLTGLQARALALAVNLESLEIALGPVVAFRIGKPPSADDPENDPFADVRWLMDGKIKVKKLIVHPLELLNRWNRPQDSDRQQYFETLLREQTDLEDLDLSDLSIPVVLHDLNKLQSLKAKDQTMLASLLKKEHPVKKLACLNGNLNNLKAAVDDIAARQGGEEVLEFAWEGSLTGKDAQTPDLNFIPYTFTKLRILKICLTASDMDGFLQKIQSMLTISNQLVKIDLDGSNDPKKGPGEFELGMMNQGGKVITFKGNQDLTDTISVDEEGNPVKKKVLATVTEKAKAAAASLSWNKPPAANPDPSDINIEPDGPYMADEDGNVLEARDFGQEIRDKEENVVKELHKQCPTLLHIILPNGHYWFRNDFEQIWSMSNRAPRDFSLLKGDPPLPMDRWDKIPCVNDTDIYGR